MNNHLRCCSVSESAAFWLHQRREDLGPASWAPSRRRRKERRLRGLWHSLQGDVISVRPDIKTIYWLIRSNRALQEQREETKQICLQKVVCSSVHLSVKRQLSMLVRSYKDCLLFGLFHGKAIISQIYSSRSSSTALYRACLGPSSWGEHTQDPCWTFHALGMTTTGGFLCTKVCGRPLPSENPAYSLSSHCHGWSPPKSPWWEPPGSFVWEDAAGCRPVWFRAKRQGFA